jgi:hypothetical protein
MIDRFPLEPEYGPDVPHLDYKVRHRIAMSVASPVCGQKWSSYNQNTGMYSFEMWFDDEVLYKAVKCTGRLSLKGLTPEEAVELLTNALQLMEQEMRR